MEEILFRSVIEVLGKPQEHVEESIKTYLKNLKEDKEFVVVKEEVAEVKKQDDAELWSVFAELEIKTNKAENIITFCIEYMPAIVEILEPEKMTFNQGEFSVFINELQSKLHQIDMVAKQAKFENEILSQNMGALLKNYLFVLLQSGGKSSEQLSKFTGVPKEKLEDYMDNLIDKGKIDLKDGLYSLKK